MRKLLILAAVAAVSAACHNRSEDEVGAAPDQGDTTAVTQVDTTAVTQGSKQPHRSSGRRGRPGNATVTGDSVGVDSTLTNQENPSTPAVSDTSLTATPQDTRDRVIPASRTAPPFMTALRFTPTAP